MEKPIILFVDDQEVTLAALKRAFLDEPYEKIFAHSGKEALEILEKKQVQVIVTDLSMPEMNGRQLLKIVMEKYPCTTRMIVSGSTQISILLAVVNECKIFKYIVKPWKFEEEFKPAIREAIEHSATLTRKKQAVNTK